jgi:hypothetical protein
MNIRLADQEKTFYYEVREKMESSLMLSENKDYLILSSFSQRLRE